MKRLFCYPLFQVSQLKAIFLKNSYSFPQIVCIPEIKAPHVSKLFLHQVTDDGAQGRGLGNGARLPSCSLVCFHAHRTADHRCTWQRELQEELVSLSNKNPEFNNTKLTLQRCSL